MRIWACANLRIYPQGHMVMWAYAYVVICAYAELGASGPIGPVGIGCGGSYWSGTKLALIG